MSVQVLKIRLPVLSIAILVERSGRRQRDQSLMDASLDSKLDRRPQRARSISAIEPTLIKLQM
jgi:hypothetical protein